MSKSDSGVLVLQEHNYSCVKIPEVSQELSDEVRPFVCPLSMDKFESDLASLFPELDIPVTACTSPSYSIDSGVDFDSSWYLNFSNLEEFDINRKKESSRVDAIVTSEKSKGNPAQMQSAAPSSSSSVKYPNEEEVVEKNRKNAEAARENRQKKKRYVESLERENADLKEFKTQTSAENSALKSQVDILKEEVTYLRSVIANQGTLSLLLKNISSTPGISLSTSFTAPNADDDEQADDSRRASLRKRKSESAASSEGPQAKKKSSAKQGTSGGVCLHVCKEKVSLEFCSSCSKNAEKAWK